MGEGCDPNAQEREVKHVRVTVEAAFELFFKTRNTLSSSTFSNYRRTEQVYLKAWRKKEMKEISRQMVLAKHQNIGRKHGEITANNVMRHFRSVYNFISATQDSYPLSPVKALS